MQVDIPSPSQQFGMSLKRMRSASPSPSPSSSTYDPERVHRPTKRPTLALRINSLDGVRRENDWVRRAGGLHISSPQPSSTSLAPSTAPSDNETESPMLTDNEPTAPPTVHVTPPLNPPDPFIRHNSPPPAIQSTDVSNSSPNTLHPPMLSVQTNQLPVQSQWRAPDIRILPATPASRFGGANSAPPSPMVISPVGSILWSPNSPNSRKTKLSIGPRTDCVKCRDGVKGHWMHFD